MVHPSAALTVSVSASEGAPSALAFHNVWDVAPDRATWLAHFPGSGMRLHETPAGERVYVCTDDLGTAALELRLQRFADSAGDPVVQAPDDHRGPC